MIYDGLNIGVVRRNGNITFAIASYARQLSSNQREDAHTTHIQHTTSNMLRRFFHFQKRKQDRVHYKQREL